jgi:hypothetical protein
MQKRQKSMLMDGQGHGWMNLDLEQLERRWMDGFSPEKVGAALAPGHAQ